MKFGGKYAAMMPKPEEMAGLDQDNEDEMSRVLPCLKMFLQD